MRHFITTVVLGCAALASGCTNLTVGTLDGGGPESSTGGSSNGAGTAGGGHSSGTTGSTSGATGGSTGSPDAGCTADTQCPASDYCNFTVETCAGDGGQEIEVPGTCLFDCRSVDGGADCPTTCTKNSDCSPDDYCCGPLPSLPDSYCNAGSCTLVEQPECPTNLDPPDGGVFVDPPHAGDGCGGIEIAASCPGEATCTSDSDCTASDYCNFTIETCADGGGYVEVPGTCLFNCLTVDGGAECPTSCATDSDCAPLAFCAAGSCAWECVTGPFCSVNCPDEVLTTVSAPHLGPVCGVALSTHCGGPLVGTCTSNSDCNNGSNCQSAGPGDAGPFVCVPL